MRIAYVTSADKAIQLSELDDSGDELETIFAEFEKQGRIVVGISRDSWEKHPE